ncbi:MAG: hypothetical protein KC620_15465, partial [Myxococcales bacterium]|nr:hypothetical protein [Myxococcales bacterium]
MLELFRAWIDRLHDFSMRRGLPWIGWAARAIELTIEIGRQLVSPQALRAAASLAFTTVLSMVPLLAVSFAVFKAFVPSTEAAAKVRGWLLGTLLADSVQDVVAVI